MQNTNKRWRLERRIVVQTPEYKQKMAAWERARYGTPEYKQKKAARKRPMFGVSLRLQQVMVEPSAKLPAFAFNP